MRSIRILGIALLLGPSACSPVNPIPTAAELKIEVPPDAVEERDSHSRIYRFQTTPSEFVDWLLKGDLYFEVMLIDPRERETTRTGMKNYLKQGKGGIYLTGMLDHEDHNYLIEAFVTVEEAETVQVRFEIMFLE